MTPTPILLYELVTASCLFAILYSVFIQTVQVIPRRAERGQRRKLLIKRVTVRRSTRLMLIC